MDEPLLTIGSFARAVGLSPSALRFYDECGLLVPAEVDAVTGYRYYTPEMARRAGLVVGMRAAGVSVDTMRIVLDGTPQEGAKALREFLDAEALRTAQAEETLAEVLDAVGQQAVAPATLRIEGPVLAAALRQVRPAAESDPTSPLAGVLVDLADGVLDVVATNRYWMAIRSLYVEVAGDPGRTVLALEEVTELAAILDARGTVEATISESRLEIDGRTWGSEVAYPAHRMLIAAVPEPTTRVVVEVAGLLALIGRGQAEVDLVISADGISPEGEGTTIRLGAPLLTQALSASLGPSVLVEVSTDVRPVLIRSPHQPDFRAVVMPIHRSS